MAPFLIRWYVVASPKRWSFDQLFKTGQIRYRFGRHKANYSHIKVGDIVVGYESAPVARIRALAKVSKPFDLHPDDEAAYFELIPLMPIKNGPNYRQLKDDEVLGNSQPMRMRSQGTLFTFTDIESERLLQMLIEADPAVKGLTSDEQLSA